jgi:hypothetical protein
MRFDHLLEREHPRETLLAHVYLFFLKRIVRLDIYTEKRNSCCVLDVRMMCASTLFLCEACRGKVCTPPDARELATGVDPRSASNIRLIVIIISDLQTSLRWC